MPVFSPGPFPLPPVPIPLPPIDDPDPDQTLRPFIDPECNPFGEGLFPPDDAGRPDPKKFLPPGLYRPAPIPDNPFFNPPGGTWEFRPRPRIGIDWGIDDPFDLDLIFEGPQYDLIITF
jgi:hypothetical protein